MVDNLGAGHGRLPDANQRVRMVKYMESLGSHGHNRNNYGSGFANATGAPVECHGPRKAA